MTFSYITDTEELGIQYHDPHFTLRKHGLVEMNLLAQDIYIKEEIRQNLDPEPLPFRK